MRPRLPRFKRASVITSLQLTERDHSIIQLVHRHRFLRSHQIVALIGGSSQQLLRRLQLLYHHGYLERPRAQLQYFERGGSKSIAYGLGDKGRRLLNQKLVTPIRSISWSEKNRAVGGIFLEHALLVSDVMVSLELACRKHGAVRLLYDDELAPPEQLPFRWKVKSNGGVKLSVVPDRVFAMEFSDASGQSQRVYFFLEADRGTMPVVRSNISQTSFHRKLIAYEATWTQDIHRRKLGILRFRVLTVTTSRERIATIQKAALSLNRGQGLFLFLDVKTLKAECDFLALRWQTCQKGETTGLLD